MTKQIHYGANGYVKTTPTSIEKWATCVGSPKLDAEFRQQCEAADQAIDRLVLTMIELRIGASYRNIDKVRLIIEKVTELDNFVRQEKK